MNRIRKSFLLGNLTNVLVYFLKLTESYIQNLANRLLLEFIKKIMRIQIPTIEQKKSPVGEINRSYSKIKDKRML
jgi:hypothetical protein